MLYDQLIAKKSRLAVVGLGYVGLPIALAFARKLKVIAFDIKAERIALMQQGIDPSKELSPASFKDTDIEFTDKTADLRQADFYVIAVPTPIDEHHLPDLKPLLAATQTVGKVLKKGDCVVFESTVYPGCTEDDCVPVLEKESGLSCPKDFKVGYSPERINPGDKHHTLSTIVKVVAGCDSQAQSLIAQIYELIVEAGVHVASSIKVAEAAKIIENTQRDVNIALMNELSMIFNKLDINTFEVLEAARTKWNFLPFHPGLVGGHCIGVDPYYLVYKAQAIGHHPQIINAGRSVNDNMGVYIAKQLVKKLLDADKILQQTKVLVMGITFKENVSDIRNSKVVDVIRELRSYHVAVDIVDPYASKEEVAQAYQLELIDQQAIAQDYDAIVLAVPHQEYLKLEPDYFGSVCKDKTILIDLKAIYKDRVDLDRVTYWSL